MLIACGVGEHSDIESVAAPSGGLRLFIRSLVGLDTAAAKAVFATYLDGERFTVDQIRFVNLIVEELTANGVVDPTRLYEAPYIDHAPIGIDYVFTPPDRTVIVEILNHIKTTALPSEVA